MHNKIYFITKNFVRLKKIIYVAVFLSVILTSLSTYARISPNSHGQIFDEVGVLSAQTIQQIMDMRLHPRVGIVIPRSFEGKTIDKYGIDLGNAWHSHKSILILMDPNGTQSRLILDGSAQAKMTPNQIHYINRQIVLASIRQGDFDGAALRAAQEIQKLVMTPPALGTTESSLQNRSTQKTYKNKNSFKDWIPKIVFFFVMFLMIKTLFSSSKEIKKNFLTFFQSPDGNFNMNDIEYLIQKSAHSEISGIEAYTYNNSYVKTLNNPPKILTQTDKIATMQQTFQQTLKKDQPVPDYQPTQQTSDYQPTKPASRYRPTKPASNYQPIKPAQRDKKMPAHIHTNPDRYRSTVPENRIDPKYNSDYRTSDKYDNSDRYNMDDLF